MGTMRYNFEGCTYYHDDIDEYEFKFVEGWCKAYLGLLKDGWKYRNIYIVDKKAGRCMQVFLYKIEEGRLADELSLTYYLPNYRKRSFYDSEAEWLDYKSTLTKNQKLYRKETKNENLKL